MASLVPAVVAVVVVVDACIQGASVVAYYYRPYYRPVVAACLDVEVPWHQPAVVADTVYSLAVVVYG